MAFKSILRYFCGMRANQSDRKYSSVFTLYTHSTNSASGDFSGPSIWQRGAVRADDFGPARSQPLRAGPGSAPGKTSKCTSTGRC